VGLPTGNSVRRSDSEYSRLYRNCVSVDGSANVHRNVTSSDPSRISAPSASGTGALTRCRRSRAARRFRKGRVWHRMRGHALPPREGRQHVTPAAVAATIEVDRSSFIAGAGGFRRQGGNDRQPAEQPPLRIGPGRVQVLSHLRTRRPPAPDRTVRGVAPTIQRYAREDGRVLALSQRFRRFGSCKAGTSAAVRQLVDRFRSVGQRLRRDVSDC
jgi:hypothetical protein